MNIKSFVKNWLKEEKSANNLSESGMLAALGILMVVVGGIVLWPYIQDGIENIGTRFRNGTNDGSTQNWGNIQP
ncbi:hypothetical protein P9850_12055 [Anoxybacillus rupiensis]|uniref:Class III signal peptide n=1 Tax=Anoxybacteroides rupiense TaxID=311460 RepID=A0ABD5IW48_9BACL|nr:hypothetical protein [Anoxybacillus rupiensis]